jgi:hypothetical protein
MRVVASHIGRRRAGAAASHKERRMRGPRRLTEGEGGGGGGVSQREKEGVSVAAAPALLLSL